MFNGIIQATAPVLSVVPMKGALRLSIGRPPSLAALKKGASLAVDGVCLTLAGFTKTAMRFDVVSQTASLTTLGALFKEQRVNLERALHLGDEFSGHLVAGHVDGVGKVVRIDCQSNDYRFTLRLPVSLIQFCPDRGSIAVNGVSLTIARARGQQITVALIPYTLAHTNLSALKIGDSVNIEVDLIARYLYRLSHQS